MQQQPAPTAPGWYYIKSLICEEILIAYVSDINAVTMAYWYESDDLHVMPCKSPVTNPALVWYGAVPTPSNAGRLYANED